MDTKFKKEIDKILKRSGKELKKTGAIKPKAYIFGDNRKVNVIPLLFSDDPRDKRLAVGHVRDIAKYHNAKCVVLISDSFYNERLEVRPSLDPFRKESIFLMGEDEKGKFAVAQEYARKFNNKIKLGKIVSDRINEPYGVMIEEPFGVCS